MWGGTQDRRLADSLQVGNVAVDEYQLADTTRTFAQTLFVQLVVLLDEQGTVSDAGFEAFVDEGLGGFILGNMSGEGQRATREWFANELVTPFDDERCDSELYAEARERSDEADALFGSASADDSHGDEYVLASTVLAAVLFFAGVSIVVGSTWLRRVLVGSATVLLAGTAGYLASLPSA